MATLAEKIRHLKPTANFLNEVRVVNDGTKEFIQFWDEVKLGVQPDQATLDAVTDSMVAADQLALDTAVAQANTEVSDLSAQADAAITQNDTMITDSDSFLLIATPTNAQLAVQVKVLTQQAKAAALQRTKIIKALKRIITKLWR